MSIPDPVFLFADGVEDGRGVPARIRADLPKCSIRAGRQRTLRRKGRWLASPSGNIVFNQTFAVIVYQ